MLDLGRAAEAEKLFDQALEVDPGHPQATYNQGLHLWRNGRMTDAAIVTALQQSQSNRPGDWNVPYLLAMIHLERLDADAAAIAFSAAEKLNSGIDIRQALNDAKRIISFAPKCLRTFKGHGVSPFDLSARDERWSAVDEMVKEITVARLKEVNSVVISTDGRWALSGGTDKTLRLWEVSSGKCMRTFLGHTGPAYSVALSTNGQWALSGGIDKTLCHWEVSSGKCMRTFLGHESSVKSVVMSADGEWALSGSSDNTLRLWEVSSGKCLRSFVGHTEGVYSVALSNDGRWALSGGNDNTMRLWDVNSGKCLRIFEGTRGPVAMSADGRWALSGSSDSSLHLWELDWELEFPSQSDWDEDLRPHLENFLFQQTPYAADLPTCTSPSDEQIKLALTHRGKPVWVDQDFQRLMTRIQYAGFGWIQPEGVRRELEKMTANWPLI